MKIKWLKAILAMSMGCAMVACNSAGEDAPEETTASEDATVSYNAGTYIGKATGMDGEVEVSVTFSDTAIESIEVVSDNETAGVGDKALTLIADDVLKYQSLGVDSVSGATISSAAMKSAIAAAAEEAGADVAALKAVPVDEEATDEVYDYDVVVVGAGLAGLTAAAEASKQGAKTALVEKLDIIGGTAVFSSGIFLATDDENGIDDLTERWIARNVDEENPMDEERVHTLVSVSPKVLELFDEAGVDFEMMDSGMIKPTASEKSIQNSSTVQLASATPTNKGGANLVDILGQSMDSMGVDVYLNTPVTALNTDENNAMVGVTSETENGTKVFNCKSVILCTGDYARNEELTAELCPEASYNYTASSVGATGECTQMAMELGAYAYSYQESMSGVFCPDPYNMPVIGQPSNSYPFSCLLVNRDAQRLVSEAAGSHGQMIYFVNEGEPDYGWVIMDQEIADNYINLDTYLEKTASGSTVIQAYQADSIASLAEAMGVDGETLQETVDRYNEMCAAGEDTDCGKDAEYLSAIDDGTYYAVKEYNCTRGNYGGLVVNDQQQLVRDDGSVIEGLYAAGIIASGMYLGDYYPGGEALGICSYSGYIAGTNAAGA